MNANAGNFTEFLALDFETTGSVRGYPNEPWQLGFVPVSGGEVVFSAAREMFFHVGDRPFAPSAPGRYNEMREKLALAPPALELFGEIQESLGGRPLVAHNASTEKNVLTRLAPLSEWGPWFDTLKICRKLYPGLEDYSLGALCRTFSIEEELQNRFPGRTWHDALFDACAGAMLFCKVLPFIA